MTEIRGLPAALVTALVLCAGPAQAQLVDPLGARPKPNLIALFDTSVTMGITSDCRNCHQTNPRATSRLDEAKVEIQRVLPIFKDLFNFGGVQYQGCGYAQVAKWVLPDAAHPHDNLRRLQDLIADARACNTKEQTWKGGALGNCLTPNCLNDGGILVGIADRTLIVPGLSFPTLPTTTATVCDQPAKLGAPLDVVAVAAANLLGLSWPRWDASTLDAATADSTLCEVLEHGLKGLRDDLATCLKHPNKMWDLDAFLAPGRASWCDAAALAATGCGAGSAFERTCVCDDSDPGCFSGARPNSECGIPLSWKARQQVGVCSAYADTWEGKDVLGSFFSAQPDNVKNGKCRENVSVFFTDGAFGDNAGVAAEASQARVTTYSSPVTGDSNMFLMHVSNYFEASADQMAAAFGNPRYSATNELQILDSFSRIVNRVYHGDYSSANLTVDAFETRAVFHLFKVPTGPGDGGERYLGRPSRLAVFPIDASGAIGGAPIFETDWASRVSWPPLNGLVDGFLCAATAPAPGAPVTGPGTGCSLSADELKAFGPLGTFRNGLARDQTVTVDGQTRRWGFMLGGTMTQPVIVDAPREVPAGSTLDLSWQIFLNSPVVKNRPRVIYVLSDGYLHAIHGGVRIEGTPTISIDGVRTKLRYNYDDDPATTPSGKELFRYFLKSYETTPDWELNDVIPRPVTTGQIVVKEMHLSKVGPPLSRHGTILALAQGKDGRAFATLNVTNPAAPRLLAEWVLPVGSAASNEPMMYQFPPTAGEPLPVVVVTGGLGGASTLYAFDIRDGSLHSSIALPAGGSYWAEPVCLDASGAGAITQCYVVSSNGLLVRVMVDAGGSFDSASVIFDASGGRRVFSTRPAVYFSAEGAVSVVFASGLSTDLLATDSAENALFKVIDDQRGAGPTAAKNRGVCRVGGAPTDGKIDLGSERVVSPPIISKGVLMFTTYRGGSDACTSGSAKLYAMNYQSCADAFDPSGMSAPAPIALGDGIPASPVLLRQKSVILAHTSDIKPATLGRPAPLVVSGVQSRGGNRTPFRPLYWRPTVDGR